MTTMRIEKLLAAPVAPFIANTLYLVKGAGAAELQIYMSDSTGDTVRHILGEAEIAQKISDAVAGLNDVQVVADIAARDAMTAALTAAGDTVQVLVLDATADVTVSTGAATYIFDGVGAAWHKISEAESMDLSLSWESLTGKPASSVADIDDAVAKRHSHANLADLNKLSTNGDDELFVNGKQVEAALATVQW